MRFDDIRETLETADRVPDGVLREALSHAAELAPLLAALIRKLEDGVYLMPRQENLLFYGAHVLAAAGFAPFWPAWHDLLRLPAEQLDELFGDSVVSILGTVTLGLARDEADALFELLEAPHAAGIVSWAVFEALARLVWEGRADRARMIALLERYERDAMAPGDPDAWAGWLDAAVLLGVTDLGPAIEQAHAEQRFGDRNEADRVETLERLAAAAADPASEQRFIEDHIVRVDDPVAALWWLTAMDARADALEAAEPDPAAITDPLAAERLSDAEIRWLGGFLVSAQTPFGTMTLEEVDGFFHALICAPKPVPPSRYMPRIWGGTRRDEGPAFDSREQAELVTTLLLRHWNAIAGRLAGGVEADPFLYSAPDAHRGRDWAAGFLGGATLDPAAWGQLARHRTAGELMNLIMALYKDDPELLGEPITPALRRELLDTLPRVVPAIHAFWRDGGSSPSLHTPKIGRNDPCPCGSGRKYKKCCGVPA